MGKFELMALPCGKLWIGRLLRNGMSPNRERRNEARRDIFCCPVRYCPKLLTNSCNGW